MKTLKYKSMFGTDYDIAFSVHNYVTNGNVAIKMWCKEDGAFEPYGNLTTNLDVKLCGDYGYIDTNNLGMDTLEWAADNGLCEFHGQYGYSGFCRYPLVKFNLDKIKEYMLEGM